MSILDVLAYFMSIIIGFSLIALLFLFMSVVYIVTNPWYWIAYIILICVLYFIRFIKLQKRHEGSEDNK